MRFSGPINSPTTAPDLRNGEKLVQLYDVVIDDGRGGKATQTVTITLVGVEQRREDSRFLWIEEPKLQTFVQPSAFKTLEPVPVPHQPLGNSSR